MHASGQTSARVGVIVGSAGAATTSFTTSVIAFGSATRRPDLRNKETTMNGQLKSACCIGALLLATQAVQAAQITFYEGEGFRGRAFTTKRALTNFKDEGINDRASSVVVDSGDWIVCD